MLVQRGLRIPYPCPFVKEGPNLFLLEIKYGIAGSLLFSSVCYSHVLKYRIVRSGEKSTSEDGSGTAVYETRLCGGVRGAPWALGLTAVYSTVCSSSYSINHMMAHLPHFHQFQMLPCFVYSLL
jgi:hypothetical protein